MKAFYLKEKPFLISVFIVHEFNEQQYSKKYISIISKIFEITFFCYYIISCQYFLFLNQKSLNTERTWHDSSTRLAQTNSMFPRSMIHYDTVHLLININTLATMLIYRVIKTTLKCTLASYMGKN